MLYVIHLGEEMFWDDPNESKQNGWACFDIAVEINRADLVKFALDHAGDIEFRKLLATEIKHAGALAVTYMLQQKEATVVNAKLIAELFAVAETLRVKADKEQLEAQAYSLLTKSRDLELPRYALPLCMHNPELEAVFLNYMQAHEQMKSALEACNETLGHIVGQRWSMEQLDRYFLDMEHQKYPAYALYAADREKIFKPAEEALISYCQRQDIYEQYIREYYDKRGWVAFQRQFHGEQSSSMVDIAAMMKQTKITVHSATNLDEILYQTQNLSTQEEHILFTGNHFISSQAKPIPTTPPHIKPPTRSDFIEKDYSDSKRPDLLPGFSGSLYQGEVAIHFMLDGLERNLTYDIKVEVGDLAK